MPSDIDIARQATLQHIKNIAQQLDIPEEKLQYYGHHKAKLPLDLIDLDKVATSNLDPWFGL